VDASPPIAVIGLGCVLPDAPNVATFWANLMAARVSIEEVPVERWDPRLYHSEDRHAPDKTYTKIGAFVKNFVYDWKRFKIPPRTLASTDESQLWALEAADQAFRDAGYDKRAFDRDRCAVILGNAGGGEIRGPTALRIYYPLVEEALRRTAHVQGLPESERQALLQELSSIYLKDKPVITEDSLPGELSNIIAGRIANVFNLGGKNFTTDAACASSVAAIEASVRALQSGECDMVLTGGVDRSQGISTYVKFAKIGALSPSGSFPFDARADGFVMGEGAGMLLLKRLEDAQRDGDVIHAVIRGVGSSSDGKGRGIVAPNHEGQVQAIHRALADAQLAPDEIDAIEAHGTGTLIGDAVEVHALNQVFSGLPPDRKIPLGSVKSNIGHLKSAAGAASLIKAVLALRHGQLPPSCGYERPGAYVKFEQGPFEVNTVLRPWRAEGRPTRIGVSSFGFGGTNFHVILESPPQHAEAGHVPSVTLVAGTPDEVRAALARLTQGDAAAPTPLEGPLRVAFSSMDVPSSAREAIEGIERPQAWPAYSARGIHIARPDRPRRIAFVFPGAGAQEPGALAGLQDHPEVRAILEQADRLLAGRLEVPLSEILTASKDSERLRQAIEPPPVHQVALLTTGVALAHALQAAGVQPEAAAGHSIGELAALTVAQALDFSQALEAAWARGRAVEQIQRRSSGAMSAVACDAQNARRLIAELDLEVAAENTPSQTVVSGIESALLRMQARCQEEGIAFQRLATGGAYHSRLMNPAKDLLRPVYEAMTFRLPGIPVYANLDGHAYPTTGDASHNVRTRLLDQLTRTVRWRQIVDEMASDGVGLFLELGPRRTLTGLIRNQISSDAAAAVAYDTPGRVGRLRLLNLQAAAAAHGRASKTVAAQRAA
jgi:acyl transferase domain-containing protein